MNEELLLAARQMCLAIVNFSGICTDPCEHGDCQHILATAAAWLEIDPLSGRLSQESHPRFDEDIDPIIDNTDLIEFLADDLVLDDDLN